MKGIGIAIVLVLLMAWQIASAAMEHRTYLPLLQNGRIISSATSMTAVPTEPSQPVPPPTPPERPTRIAQP